MLEMTGSKSLTALVSMSAYLPALIFGLFVGVIVDRYNRKSIMIFSDIMRFLLVSLVPIALIFDFASPLLVGIITFFLAIFSTLFYPARDCLIPHIANPKELPAANSAIVISGQMSHMLGPLIAGIGMSIFGLTHLFTVDAITFLFSIIMISLIVIPVINQPYQKSASKIESIKEGFRYIRREKHVGTLLFLTFINNLFIMGPAIIGLPVFVKEILKEEFAVLAYLETAMAGGMILGSIIFWIAIKHFKPVPILLIGVIIDGLTFSLLYAVQSNYVAILVLLIHGIGIPLIIVARTTLIQKTVPDKLQGRIFSMIYMSVMGTSAISIGLTGMILEYFGSDSLFLIIGLCAASCAWIGLISQNFISFGKKVN
jgi:MFS family permease